MQVPGNTQMRHPSGDVKVVPDELVDQFTGRGWERTGVDSSNDLKGAALDEALDAAGLPKSGTADEKRARLAEHQAGENPDA